MDKLRAEFKQEVAEFILKAVIEGYKTEVDGMGAHDTVVASDSVGKRMEDFFGIVANTSDNLLEEGVAEARKYLGLFSIEEEYKILKSGKSTPMFALMTILVDGENDELFKDDDMFAYAIQQGAEHIHESLVELGCTDPVLRENAGQAQEYALHSSMKELLDMMEDWDGEDY